LACSLAALFLFGQLSQDIAWALPSGWSVEEGTVTVDDQTPGAITFNASDRAILNFDSFSIAQNESVRFVLPSENSSVLSRILGNSQSDIYGSLFSNGQLVLVNPSGIHFGESANIQVHSLIASTLDIQNAMYLDNQMIFERQNGKSPSEILNEAFLAAGQGGSIAFLSDKIENRGSLTAEMGSVVLASGKKTTLSLVGAGYVNAVVNEGSEETQEIALLNAGSIHADGGKVTISAKTLGNTMNTLINNTGVIEAQRIVEKDGVVELVSNGAIQSSGSLIVERLFEDAAAFSVGGNYHVGVAHVQNRDGAVTLNTGDYSGVTQDPGDIIVSAGATITLIGNTTFWADDDSDGGPNGSGAFIMNLGSSIIGQDTWDLTLKASEASTLRTIQMPTTFTLQESKAGSNPVYTANNDITARRVVLGSGTLTMNGFSIDTTAGTGYQQNGGTFNAGSGAQNFYGGFDFNAGTFNANSSNIDVMGNIDFTGSGTFNRGTSVVYLSPAMAGTYTVNSNGQSFYDFRSSDVSGGGNPSVELASPLVVTNDFTIESGIFDVSASNYAITVGGNFSNAGDMNFRSGIVTFNATDTGNTIDTGGSGHVFSSVVFNGAGGTWDLTNNDMSIGTSLTITAGTFDLNGYDLSMTGAAFENAGILRLKGNESVLNLNNDTNSGTVEYDGTLDYTGDGLAAGNDYYHLTFSGPGTWTLDNSLDVNGDLTIQGHLDSQNQTINLAGDWINSGTYTSLTDSGGVVLDGIDQILYGSTDFYSLSKHTLADDTLYFEAGSTITADNLTLSGDAGHLLRLRSTVDGTRWNLNTTLTPSVAYLNVKDGYYQNSGFSPLDPVMSTNSGHNVNWFTGDPTGVYTWIGGTTDWAVGSNWDQASAPGATDEAVIANVDDDPIFSGNVTLQALTLNTGAILDLNGYDLSVSGAISNNGTIRLKGDENFSGTMDSDSGTVEYYGTGTYLGGLVAGDDYYNLTFNGSGGSWELDTTLDVNNNLTIQVGTLHCNAFIITVGGNWSNSGTFDSASGAVRFDATTPGHTIDPGSSEFVDLYFNGVGGVWDVMNNPLVITDQLGITNGILDLNGNNMTCYDGSPIGAGGVLRLKGNETLTGWSYEASAGTIEYDGTGSYTTSLAAGNSYYNLTFSGDGGVWEPDGAVYVDNVLTIGVGATFDLDGYDISNGAGSFINNGTLRLEGAETVGLHNDTDSGTVEYDGSGGYTGFNAGMNTSTWKLTGPGLGRWMPISTLTGI